MDVAIVGAGAAGAGVAYAARDAPADVTVFECEEAIGGRTAARQQRGCTYDPGANYLKADDPRVGRLVTDILDPAELVDVGRPVWTFDTAGSIAPGDDRDEHKWTHEAGLSRLVECLLERADAAVRVATPVTGLRREADEWILTGPDGRLGRFDRVVLTPPAPESATLLDRVDVEEALVDELRAVPYRPVVSAILHYPFRLERPYYALVNVDRGHPLSWVSREEEKRGHVPDGESLLIVQLAPEPSERWLDGPADAAGAEAASLVADLLDDDRLATPDWTDFAAWRHALVDGAADGSLLRAVRPSGLSFAGDWVRGEARVHAALRSGLEAGDRLAAAATRDAR